jgi:hypothetical protein
MGTIASKDLLRQRRSRVVHARFSELEIERIEHAAQAVGITVSGFLRSLTLEGAGVRPFLTDADRAVFSLLLSDVKAVGVNLNQLARARNRGETGQSQEEKRVIDDIQRILAVVLFELRSFAESGARRRTGGV